MSLLFPGVGDIGTVVNGKSTPARVEGNGGNAVLATIDIPSAGVWIVCASGWLPISGKDGYAALLNGYASLCGTDTGKYQFSMSGILSASGATQVKLQYTSWDTVAHDNAQIGGLTFRAVKVGGA